MTERDSLVLNIELTLISIIQGVALYFLVESSRVPIVERHYAAWPYIAGGLVIILLFWSRSIIHGLTVIRWPLEFGHNFLYVALTLVECVAFTQVGNPRNWFALNAVYASLIWLLFIWDLRLIRRRAGEDRSPSAQRLYAVVQEDQLRNIRILLPATLAFTIGATLLIHYFPGFFLERGGHWILALLQLGAALAYLAHGMRFYARLKPLQDEALT